MADLFNIYCDESCHLERDGQRIMVLGCVWCKASYAPVIAKRIRGIKARHKLPGREFEIKWTKVSPAKLAFFAELIENFFSDDGIHFRAVLVPDKTKLDHAAYNQNHDDWYYKMCFQMLEPLIDPTQSYSIYLDIKDTRSEKKRAELEKTLRETRPGNSVPVIKKVQQIRSRESELMQMADLLMGAVGYSNRNIQTSKAKCELVRIISMLSGKDLSESTWLREPKFNIFCWHLQGREK